MRLATNGLTGLVALLAVGLAGCATTRADTDEPDVIVTSEEPTATTVGGSAVVPSGTVLTAKLDQELSVDENKAGDAFTATLSEPVMSGGSVVVPAGAKIHGQITAVQDEDDSDEYEYDVLKLNFTRLAFDGESYPLQARLIEANPEMQTGRSTGETVAGVAGGAAAGAILGRIIGGDAKGTLIGAALGAAAGTAIVLGTGDEKAVLDDGSVLKVRTQEQISITRR